MLFLQAPTFIRAVQRTDLVSRAIDLLVRHLIRFSCSPGEQVHLYEAQAGLRRVPGRLGRGPGVWRRGAGRRHAAGQDERHRAVRLVSHRADAVWWHQHPQRLPGEPIVGGCDQELPECCVSR